MWSKAMSKYPKICNGCVYFHKHHANFDKAGNRTVSSYWCSAKNGRITTKPKQCVLRKEKQPC